MATDFHWLVADLFRAVYVMEAVLYFSVTKK